MTPIDLWLKAYCEVGLEMMFFLEPFSCIPYPLP